MAELRAVGPRCNWRWLVLVVSVLCVSCPVSAIDVYGPSELFIENGTEARLPCTFKSSEVTSTSLLAIWKFDAQSKGGDFVTIFYYTGGTNQHKSKDQFTGRISWAGDLNKRDVSVKIKNMQFIDNGTYECTVFNPPDVSGKPNKIKLRVVERENLPASNVPFLVGIICGVIGGILLIALLIFALVICKRKRSKKNYSGCSTTESLMSVKQPPRKSPGTEELVKPMPSAPIQGPVIYAQLDHSGKPSNQIIKSESVVYSNIRRLC